MTLFQLCLVRGRGRGRRGTNFEEEVESGEDYIRDIAACLFRLVPRTRDKKAAATHGFPLLDVGIMVVNEEATGPGENLLAVGEDDATAELWEMVLNPRGFACDAPMRSTRGGDDEDVGNAEEFGNMIDNGIELMGARQVMPELFVHVTPKSRFIHAASPPHFPNLIGIGRVLAWNEAFVCSPCKVSEDIVKVKEAECGREGVCHSGARW